MNKKRKALLPKQQGLMGFTTCGTYPREFTVIEHYLLLSYPNT